MIQTEAYEIFTIYLCKLALTCEIINLHFHGPMWRMLIHIPAFILGMTNAIALRAIHETLGTEMTNNAIFGNHFTLSNNSSISFA